MVTNALFFTTTEVVDFALVGNEVVTGGATAFFELRNTSTGDTFGIGDSGRMEAGSWVLSTQHSGTSLTVDSVTTGVEAVDFDVNLQLTPIPEPTCLLPLALVMGLACRRRIR